MNLSIHSWAPPFMICMDTCRCFSPLLIHTILYTSTNFKISYDAGSKQPLPSIHRMPPHQRQHFLYPLGMVKVPPSLALLDSMVHVHPPYPNANRFLVHLERLNGVQDSKDLPTSPSKRGHYGLHFHPSPSLPYHLQYRR